jgi:hypothetical protein
MLPVAVLNAAVNKAIQSNPVVTSDKKRECCNVHSLRELGDACQVTGQTCNERARSTTVEQLPIGKMMIANRSRIPTAETIMEERSSSDKLAFMASVNADLNGMKMEGVDLAHGEGYARRVMLAVGPVIVVVTLCLSHVPVVTNVVVGCSYTHTR